VHLTQHDGALAEADECDVWWRRSHSAVCQLSVQARCCREILSAKAARHSLIQCDCRLKVVCIAGEAEPMVGGCSAA
jgi:hypothetical protein